MIDGTPGFTLVGAFPDANQALENVATSRPDVVLLDIEMPGASGIEALKVLKQSKPNLHVLMQTVFEDDAKVFESICSGASGYILKNTQPARIPDAIIETAEGGPLMTPLIARKVLQMVQMEGMLTPASASELFSLTLREKEVLTLMVQGMSYKMIAAQCYISFEKVRSHIRNIYKKLQVATMTDAVAKAIRSGLV